MITCPDLSGACPDSSGELHMVDLVGLAGLVVTYIYTLFVIAFNHVGFICFFR